MSPFFTLTTDFGLQDPYVGQLKGALLTGCPSATIVDLTHAIPAWDVTAAALVLRTSYRFFPAGTIHLAVVDPGVGSERAILAAAGDGHWFVAPDNGLLSLLATDGCITAVHRVDHPDFFPPTVSATFHGRDIMAPVAAALAGEHNLARLGPALPVEGIRQCHIPPATVNEAGMLLGQVWSIDQFGNVRTSIRADETTVTSAAFMALTVGDQRIDQWVCAYHQIAPDSLSVLIDSAGFLEIAANQARAADLLGCMRGDLITLQLRRGPKEP